MVPLEMPVVADGRGWKTWREQGEDNHAELSAGQELRAPNNTFFFCCNSAIE